MLNNIILSIASKPIAPYGELKNVPKDPIVFDGNKMPGAEFFKKFFETTENFSKLTKGFFDIINGTVWYATHPLEIWKVIEKYSFSGCLIVGTLGIVIYILGHKKGAKITRGSVVSYIIIKSLSVVI